MSKYLIKNREKLLPWIKDWTDPQDHIRFEKDVMKLSWMEWYWCHPSAYTLMYYGQHVTPGIIFGLTGCLFYFLGQGILTILMVGFSLFSWYGLFKKLKYQKKIKNFTHYDLYLRDYVIQEDK